MAGFEQLTRDAFEYRFLCCSRDGSVKRPSIFCVFVKMALEERFGMYLNPHLYPVCTYQKSYIFTFITFIIPSSHL